MADYKAADFLKAIEGSHGIIAHVAKKLQCSRQTVYNAMDRYTSVRQAIEDERETMLDFAENRLFKQINEDNMTAIIFYLKTQGKNRGYVERTEQRVDANVNMKGYINFTPDDWDDDSDA